MIQESKSAMAALPLLWWIIGLIIRNIKQQMYVQMEMTSKSNGTMDGTYQTPMNQGRKKMCSI
jgi:hypothetical protein